jgi:putative ABC transport system permease protein
MAGLFMSDLLDQLGVSLELSWSSIWPLMKGAMLGLLSTLLFTLWPLLRIRDIHPGAIFRRDAEQSTVEQEALPSRWWVRWGLADRWNVGTAGGIILGLCALSIWQAGSWSIGFLFLGALSVAITVLFVCARMFVRGLAWMPLPRVLSLRYALGNVVRPGSQATGIMVAKYRRIGRRMPRHFSLSIFSLINRRSSCHWSLSGPNGRVQNSHRLYGRDSMPLMAVSSR